MTATKFAARYECGEVEPYQFQIPTPGATPTDTSMTAADMLLQDVFIDKSEVVYEFLRRRYHEHSETFSGDFGFVPLSVFSPKHLGKTTLLDFMEAVFNPVVNDRFHEVLPTP